MNTPSDDSHELDYRAALAKGLLPIREVARQTGVNPVTLRAWERRYGLIVPLRTGKGHRLYTAEDVARIRLILTWLDRGVAVSQVKSLLDIRQAKPQPPDSSASPWQEQRRLMLEAIGNLCVRQLDEGFNAALALYPPQTLYRQLLRPLLEELEQRWHGQFGGQVERVFLHTWLRTKLAARIHHNNRQCTGAPVLLANLSERPMEPDLWLSAWLVSSAACNVEVFDWPVPPTELALAVARIQPSALLVHANQPLSPGQLARLFSGHPCPCLLSGPAATIHRADSLPGVILTETPLDAAQALADLNLPRTR